METSRDDFVIAIRSAFLKKGNQQTFSLLSLILFSIIFLILGNFNFKIIELNKKVIKEIIYISSNIVSVPENTFKKYFSKISDHLNHYDDYQKTKNELQELKNKDLSKKIITFENIELRKLIDDYFVEDKQTYAKILMDNESPFLRSIVINKGSKNGVKEGMTVYDKIYLIGKVVEVNFFTSRVLLISDINSKVPVTILPLNIEAIMSGFNTQQGKLQYILDEKLINGNNEELIVVTSGIGGFFKTGIPIGIIDSEKILKDKEIVVNFYRNFSQLKYVKVLGFAKESENLDRSNKESFEAGNNQLLTINNQIEVIKALKKQKVINEEIRVKFEKENTGLKENLINVQEKLPKKNKDINENKAKIRDIKFLELNLLHGHKCKKSFFKPKLYEIKTIEYKNCVFNKGLIKNN